MDAERMVRTKAFVEEFRKFYNENGYLPHKAAERLIRIAEELLRREGGENETIPSK